ncbi:glycosyltransferase family 2 protein [Mucilaginibacter sp.]|uniref:glycosyltransferase family 2 protein n=1 Tax=Mucilaginibacter sp. TaxID=1882438 RepID=UPI000CA99A24|nr:glycosyltransferase family 2 protein [Mucilaginibacter sp.]PLW88460.1 MAG: hypothetical protein C0154_16565 [Mucilaginibacter sp.]HEK20317.1 glycosyltransferase family 2 protein [Bacteroidota bacterium]
MTLPLISVALCTYNGEKYIEAQLNSLIHQTYKNLEIIIVDDGSTDDTARLIQQMAANDGRIKFYRNEQNLGFNQNFQKAIGLTTGEYIAICDQDDIWAENKIEILHQHIGDNWLIFSNSSCIDEQDKTLEWNILRDFNFGSRNYKSILLHNWVTGHTSLFKREFLDYLLPIPPDGYYDWWMGFVALYHNKITYLDQVLTRYRIHSASVTQQEQNITEKAYKLKWLEIVLTMVNNFRQYKNLADADQLYINKLYRALTSKKHSLISFPLLSIINRDYHNFFPDSKQRKPLSRLNFAFKFAKGFKFLKP